MAYRVGEAHPHAVLTDEEVDRLLEDRGPDHAPRMSYTELARKWGVSKSCVRDIVTGSRRRRSRRPTPPWSRRCAQIRPATTGGC